MGLTTLDPPEGAAKKACEFLAALKSGPGFQTRGELSKQHLRLYLAAPHPVFNLPLDQLDEDMPFESAVMTGWNYLVISSGATLATIELTASNHHDTPSFCRVTDGRMAKSAARGLVMAERSATVKGGDYVLGMIRVPSIHVHALWLRDGQADGIRDLFALLEPAPIRSATDHLWSPRDFLSILRGRRAIGQ